MDPKIKRLIWSKAGGQRVCTPVYTNGSRGPTMQIWIFPTSRNSSASQVGFREDLEAEQGGVEIVDEYDD